MARPSIWMRLVARATGMNPLSASRIRQVMPYFFPTTRRTFVAPMLPEPIRRTSPAPASLVRITPNGTEPIR